LAAGIVFLIWRIAARLGRDARAPPIRLAEQEQGPGEVFLLSFRDLRR
jgi:hypothetical protein